MYYLMNIHVTPKTIYLTRVSALNMTPFFIVLGFADVSVDVNNSRWF